VTRRYDKWAGNPRGIRESAARCVAQVADSTGFHFLQCGRRRGHGPDGLFCKQHARMIDGGRRVSVPEEEEKEKP
jgi:hypothetical protein